MSSQSTLVFGPPAGVHPAGGHPAGGHPAGGHPAGGHPAGGHYGLFSKSTILTNSFSWSLSSRKNLHFKV